MERIKIKMKAVCGLFVRRFFRDYLNDMGFLCNDENVNITFDERKGFFFSAFYITIRGERSLAELLRKYVKEFAEKIEEV